MTDAGVREATAPELEDWDSLTVDVPGGSVHQSRAWAEYQASVGWRPRFLAVGERRVLALERRWPLVGGGEAYLPRGPVTAGDALNLVADRLVAATDYLAGQGTDTLASDAEIEAGRGYTELVHERGFESVEEIQPSRHKVALALTQGATSEQAFAGLSMSGRQRVRGAIKSGLKVVAWDACPTDAYERCPDIERRPSSDLEPTALAPTVDRFYSVIAGTAARRQFRIVDEQRFKRWALLSLGPGLSLLLEVHDADGELLGGGLFHRHGGRLTYFIAGDRAENRKRYPGVMHLLVWRAIELAIASGLSEVDLGGVDVRGARHKPVEGDEMYGVLAFKEAFGARFVELAGNQQRFIRPARASAGRFAQRVAARLGRGG